MGHSVQIKPRQESGVGCFFPAPGGKPEKPRVIGSAGLGVTRFAGSRKAKYDMSLELAPASACSAAGGCGARGPRTPRRLQGRVNRPHISHIGPATDDIAGEIMHIFRLMVQGCLSFPHVHAG